MIHHFTTYVQSTHSNYNQPQYENPMSSLQTAKSNRTSHCQGHSGNMKCHGLTIFNKFSYLNKFYSTLLRYVIGGYFIVRVVCVLFFLSNWKCFLRWHIFCVSSFGHECNKWHKSLSSDHFAGNAKLKFESGCHELHFCMPSGVDFALFNPLTLIWLRDV